MKTKQIIVAILLLTSGYSYTGSYSGSTGGGSYGGSTNGSSGGGSFGGPIGSGDTVASLEAAKIPLEKELKDANWDINHRQNALISIAADKAKCESNLTAVEADKKKCFADVQYRQDNSEQKLFAAKSKRLELESKISDINQKLDRLKNQSSQGGGSYN